MVLSWLTSESELSSDASVVEVERGPPVCDFTDKTNSNDKRKVGHMLIDVHSIRNMDIICLEDSQLNPYLY